MKPVNAMGERKQGLDKYGDRTDAKTKAHGSAYSTHAQRKEIFILFFFAEELFKDRFNDLSKDLITMQLVEPGQRAES